MIRLERYLNIRHAIYQFWKARNELTALELEDPALYKEAFDSIRPEEWYWRPGKAKKDPE